MELADGCADQMAKRFLSERLPPALLASEEAASSEGFAHAESRLREVLMGSGTGVGARKKDKVKDKGKSGDKARQGLYARACTLVILSSLLSVSVPPFKNVYPHKWGQRRMISGCGGAGV